MGFTSTRKGLVMSSKKDVREYLTRRWSTLYYKGAMGSINLATYLRANTKHVYRNIKDSPDYLKEALKRLDLLNR